MANELFEVLSKKRIPEEDEGYSCQFLSGISSLKFVQALEGDNNVSFDFHRGREKGYAS